MKKIMLFMILLGLGTVPAMADLFQNGSFENGTLTNTTFTTLQPGSTDITGWKVINGSIDYIGTYWAASDGSRSLDLNGTLLSGQGPNAAIGGIQQTFDTSTGQAYLVTFDMAGNPDNDPVLKTMVVGADSTTQSFNFGISSTDKTNMGWTAMNFTFIASSASTTLQFISNTPGQFGPALDNVSVSIVPVPGAVLLCLLGLSAAGIKLRKFA